jgi:hypothetical protein
MRHLRQSPPFTGIESAQTKNFRFFACPVARSPLIYGDCTAWQRSPIAGCDVQNFPFGERRTVSSIFNGFAKIQKLHVGVIPAYAGIQSFQIVLDAGSSPA